MIKIFLPHLNYTANRHIDENCLLQLKHKNRIQIGLFCLTQ